MATIIEWLQSLDWTTMFPEMIGKFLGFLFGFAASWFLLFRKRLNDLKKLQIGDSDDVIFQMHALVPVSEEKYTLIFRNLAPKTTLNDLYDNEFARKTLKKLADNTSLADPIIRTSGTIGFEMLNDAAGHIAGLLATSTFERKNWLFMLTCEDRQVVRKKCIRAFLIQPDDLVQFEDWNWCTQSVLVESPWHWFRVVALHKLAILWRQQNNQDRSTDSRAMPLVDKQFEHDRIRILSVGINTNEKPIGTGQEVAWHHHAEQLREIGLDLPRHQRSRTDGPIQKK